jgi:two-component system chemotaxis response regulator CheB
MNKIRVLVVEDSVTVRKRLVELLSTDPQIEIAGEAGDGKTAIDMCLRLRPDVVTLDMHIPGLSGLAVTEYLMAYCPTPILIVSASTNRGDLYKTYEALAAGALDVLEKASGGGLDGNWERDFVSAVKLVSRLKVITHMRGRTGSVASLPPAPPALCPGPYRLVAIGASTGGPAAVLQILQDLPSGFPIPILMVIHIGESFGEFLAEWLDSQSGLRVGCAQHGELLPEVGQARVILAPPGRHVVVFGNRLHLTNHEERHSCRPSVDVLFESVAREIGPQSIACLLTGMGKDGAQGLLAVRRAGGRTLAQDEATSTIFGMPQEAIRIGAAEKVVGLRAIAPALVALAGGGSNGGPRDRMIPCSSADR